MNNETKPPAIVIEGLAKHYGSVCAVDHLDLTVSAGEICCLLGPNGAGKTTTTEVLEGYRQRDGGRVEVLGQDPGRAGLQWRSRIGIVPQTSREQPELTVIEMVRHFASFYPAAREPNEVIDTVGLTDKARTRIRKLSGGQRRRLDVALGIVGNPELLFLDEPTTGFDPEARRSFWQLVRSLRDDGTTILLTTHYLDEAAALADRVAVVLSGTVIALGSPSELAALDGGVVVRWREGNRPCEQRTHEPTALVRALSGPGGVEIEGLEVLRPSLEDVYLQLINSGARASDRED